MQRVTWSGLQVAKELADFIEIEALPGTGVAGRRLLDGFAAIVRDLAPQNRALLAQRDALQAQIDAWHRDERRPRTTRPPTRPSCARSAISFPRARPSR